MAGYAQQNAGLHMDSGNQYDRSYSSFQGQSDYSSPHGGASPYQAGAPPQQTYYQPPAPPGAPPPPQCAPPWVALWDMNTHRYYFENTHTRVTTWEYPGAPVRHETPNYGAYPVQPTSYQTGPASHPTNTYQQARYNSTAHQQPSIHGYQPQAYQSPPVQHNAYQAAASPQPVSHTKDVTVAAPKEKSSKSSTYGKFAIGAAKKAMAYHKGQKAKQHKEQSVSHQQSQTHYGGAHNQTGTAYYGNEHSSSSHERVEERTESGSEHESGSDKEESSSDSDEHGSGHESSSSDGEGSDDDQDAYGGGDSD